jgi:hypothetical protein
MKARSSSPAYRSSRLACGHAGLSQNQRWLSRSGFGVDAGMGIGGSSPLFMQLIQIQPMVCEDVLILNVSLGWKRTSVCADS